MNISRTREVHASLEASRQAPLWTGGDVAARLNLSEKTIINWRSLGIGPPFLKAGGAVRYRAEDIAAWEEANLATGTAAA